MAPVVQRLHQNFLLQNYRVSEASCVVAGYLWRIIGCGEDRIVLEHATGDVVDKLLYLFTNVSEESVRGPAANEHEGEGWDSVELHRHGGSRADGVGSNVLGMEA